MSLSSLQAIKRQPGIYISDVISLQCNSRSGAGKKVDEIINRSHLPEVFLKDDFRQFRVATKSSDGKKVTIDIDTRKYATGSRVDMPLYSFNELMAIGDIPGADYLQFIPEGTPYAILDFDTDKKLEDNERQEQVDWIFQKILHQFDGHIELSSSGLGIHAYIEDKRVKDLGSDPFKFHITDDKGRRIDVEVFAGNAPIILTCDYIEEAVSNFDVVPKRLMSNINKEVTDSTPVKSDNIALTKVDIEPEELSRITERFKALDSHNRMYVGYDSTDDCSSVDFAMAAMLIKATDGDKEQSYSLLHSWMQKWRPESHCKKSPKEIKNKATRAINNAYKKLLTEKLINTQNSSATNNKISMKEAVMKRSHKAGVALERIGRSKSLVESVFYEGTLNILYAKSGSGKTKVAVILTMLIAEKYPDKYVYYYAPDLSLDDIKDVKSLAQQKGLENYFIDQDSIGKDFMEMMETYGKSDDVYNLVFVVDTLKKIASVNNKDSMSKTMGMLKQVTLRGATGIIVAHTNKDGETISGTAEVEQDSDNVLTVETEYMGEDQMKVTVMASELRCRSRIEPLTLEISRDGFEYKFSEDHVNTMVIKAQEKEIERMGNIIEIAQDVVCEYAEKNEPLTKTQLQHEIREADAYTGNRKNEILSKMIDKLGENFDITLTREGRSILCTPHVHSVIDLIQKADFNN